MSDETKLVAGPLTAEMVPLLTEQSILTKCAGLAIVRFEGWHLNEVWKRPDVIAGAEIVPHYMFNYLGEITPDGWIEGEWAENPVPGMDVDVRWNDGEVWSDTPATPALKWANIIAFRPAHREAQPETDGGGEAGDWPQDTAFKIASDLHAAYEQLIYGLPKYLDAENLTDEENMIREAHITLDVTAHRLAALASKGV